MTKAYLETCRFLEQEKAFESGGNEQLDGGESIPPDDDKRVFGGAKIGDLIQWEIDGVLQMEKPMRVRLVTEDGQWVAVEGSETGIPMNEVTVEERTPAAAAPAPRFKLEEPGDDLKTQAGETEWMRRAVKHKGKEKPE